MLKINSLHFSYENTPILSNVTLSLARHEIGALCGISGSGKSTLLHLLKKALRPNGTVSGEIYIGCDDSEIAIVSQNPNTQIVRSTVRQELVFPMENHGLPNAIMRKRLAETASFLGIERLLDADCETLSGGQKQLVTLASALMTQPKLLLLDEPLSMLDPINARDLLDLVLRLNRECGITVLIAEHNIENILPYADKMFVLNTTMRYSGSPKAVLRDIWQKRDKQAYAHIPPLQKLYFAATDGDNPPLSVKESRALAESLPAAKVIAEIPQKRDVLFKLVDIIQIYNKDSAPVLNRLNLTIYSGECLCIIGGNGSGKTTLLKIIAGIIKPTSGKSPKLKAAYIPQNINAYFRHEKVGDELIECEQKHKIIEQFNLSHLLNAHPYDLSGGERQRVAIAAALLEKPQLLLLDEPTKGMDDNTKQTLLRLLHELQITTIITTHDLDFAAQAADRCALVFDGQIAHEAPPLDFFADNIFYTTQLHKAIGGNALTFAQAAQACNLRTIEGL